VEPERSCWNVDVATRAVTPVPVTAPQAAPLPAKAEARADGTLRLCGPGGSPCKSIANPTLRGNPEWLAVSDDLSTVAFPDGDALRIFDVARAKVRATIHGWPDSPMGHGGFPYPPTFASPERLLVWDTWTPVSEQGRIFDMSGKQLAIVGKDFLAMEADKRSWRIHATEWAIQSEANEILIVDVMHPEVTTTYELSALLALPRPDNDHKALAVLAVAGTAQRLVIVTGENPVTIGIIDRATNKLEKLEPPRCPMAR
jgi:hypothetical protein